MRILGLICISPKDDDNVTMAEESTMADLDLGPCVHWGFSPDDIKKFAFGGENEDIDSLVSRLVALKKNGRFQHWSIEWYLCDHSGVIMNGGLVLEDEKSGAIINRPWGTHDTKI